MNFSLPISFKEFVQDPVKAILFFAVIAIMYLYVDNKMVYKDNIAAQAEQINKLEIKIEKLQEKLEIMQVKLVDTINKHENAHAE